MKKANFLYTLVLALVFPALVVGQQTSKNKGSQAGGVEQQLKQMEDEWAKAGRTKDASALKRIIAEDWVATSSKGKSVNREQEIAHVTSNPDVVQSNEYSDMQVRVYGNTAVVRGGSTEKGTRNGTAYTDTYRWTDVFVKRGGHWQAVASQSTKLP